MRQELASYGIYQKLFSENQRFLREASLEYYGKTITYRGLFAQTERCARAFSRWEVKRGDSVLVCSAAVPELVYALMALWRLGAVPHLLDPMSVKEHLAQWMEASGASLVLVLDPFFSCIDSMANKNVRLRSIVIPLKKSVPILLRRAKEAKHSAALKGLHATRSMLWKEFLESGQSIFAPPMISLSREETAAVLYTDACASSMKQGDICDYIDWHFQCTWTRRERFINKIPPWQAKGLIDSLIAPLCRGLTVVLDPCEQVQSIQSTISP